jgi:hypothetical protein
MVTLAILDAIWATDFGLAVAEKGHNNSISYSVSSIIPDRSYFDTEDQATK